MMSVDFDSLFWQDVPYRLYPWELRSLWRQSGFTAEVFPAMMELETNALVLSMSTAPFCVRALFPVMVELRISTFDSKAAIPAPTLAVLPEIVLRTIVISDCELR